MKRFIETGRTVYSIGAFFSRSRIASFLGTQARDPRNAKGGGVC
jgi:hypothetical protein